MENKRKLEKYSKTLSTKDNRAWSKEGLYYSGPYEYDMSCMPTVTSFFSKIYVGKANKKPFFNETYDDKSNNESPIHNFEEESGYQIIAKGNNCEIN